MTAPRILVAGIGNVFFGDDGFGCALAERLCRRELPSGVSVSDFGIRGLHLAYELADGWDAAVIVDIAMRGRTPGTLTILEPEIPSALVEVEAHRIDPVAVLALVPQLGTLPRALRLLVCEPERLDEEGLSECMVLALEPAEEMVMKLVDELRVELSETGSAQHA